MVYKKVCEICGSKFDGGAPNAKYCSTECKKEGKRRSQRKFWKKHDKPWFQQGVGNPGDPGDDRVPDSKDPLESGDLPAGNPGDPGDAIVNPDSKDPQGHLSKTWLPGTTDDQVLKKLQADQADAGLDAGLDTGSQNPPAGSSGDPGDDRVPDSKDPSGWELSKVARETKPSNPDSKDPQGSGDIHAGSKQSFLDDFFEWLGW